MKEKACQQMRFTDWFWKALSPNSLSVLLARTKKRGMFVYQKLKHFAVTHSLDFYQDELDPVEHSKERWWWGKKSWTSKISKKATIYYESKFLGVL